MSFARLALPVLVLCLATLGARAEQSYSRGKNASPAYEGWGEEADGTRYFLFGYMNRNWEEELDVWVGTDNFFAPGDPDRGQPTHFVIVYRSGLTKGTGVLSGARRIDVTMSIKRIPL